MNSQESNKFKLNYRKTKPINLEEWVNETVDVSQNSPYKISKLQQYNPIYSKFFELTDQNYDSISLNHKYQIQGLNSVLNTETNQIEEKRVFTKFSPLLDPIRYMIGSSKDKNEDTPPKSILEYELPKFELPDDCNSKMPVPNTDAFFSFLTSTLLNHHDFKHGIDYYGSYLGIQDRFRINIEDDLEYLHDSDFFMKNIGSLITLENYTSHNEFANFGSRGNKIKLKVSGNDDTDLLIDSIIDLDDSELDKSTIDLEELTEFELDTMQNKDKDQDKDQNEDQNEDQDKSLKNISNHSYSSNNSSNNSKLNYSTDEDAEQQAEQQQEDDTKWSTDSSQESSSTSSSQDYDIEKETHAYLHNFPVQMICLEKCNGTFDELFVKKLITPENGASALFQIIMTLILYQKAFHFTHNDLHTNNVMYVNTEQEYVYYTYNNIHYKVPTYGRIFKIIDFGRSIYKYQDKVFCSESFAQGGDASTQYNCEPYLNKNKPRLDPNYSFDLCRLGCSIFDFIIDDDEPYNSMNTLQKTIHRWCLDDSKKNILYKKNGEERYPNFKLYKMIARTVHQHTPQEQLEFPFFKQFRIETTEQLTECMDIDKIPAYTSK